MEYKKIIRNQKNRFRILKFLSWIPDALMIQMQYRIKMGFWPNLVCPKRFSEKLQVYKLKYRNQLMHQCVDKYEVRNFVRERGLGYILNDLYGVYDRAEDIDYEKLPYQFVAKTTDGAGGCNIKIVENKYCLNFDKFQFDLNNWLGMKDINAGREWAYTGIKRPRIIIEKLLKQEGGKLLDYKFFCFNGEAKFLYIAQDMVNQHAKAAFINMDWEIMPFKRLDYAQLEELPPRPSNFDEMRKVAEVLSSGFPHVRVDLYDIQNKVIFGELTFYNASGYMKLSPDKYDYIIGDMFHLPTNPLGNNG